MSPRNLLTPMLALLCGLALVAGAASTTLAQPNNDQSGLVNVNLQDLALQIPVSVALPIGIAANVCNVSVIEVRELGDTGCTAESNSTALSRSVADTMLGTGGNGGSRNNQSGLVNVNVQEVIVQVPVSLAVPIGVAANVCNVSVIELQETGATDCDAETTSRAFSRALARTLLEQNP